MRIDENGRECAVCHRYLLWAEFNKNIQHPYGYDYRCKPCQKESVLQAERERGRRDYADPVKREQQKARMREYRKRPEVQRRRIEQASHANELKRKRDREHPEIARARNRKAMKKWMSNTRNRLSSNVSALVRSSLAKGVKNGRHWETLVPYTLDALKAHLEALWEPGMTWDNHTDDGWHIDHVKPVRAFAYSTPEDQSFKDCWALANLAPRWATTEIARRYGSTQTGNLNKSDRFS